MTAEPADRGGLLHALSAARAGFQGAWQDVVRAVLHGHQEQKSQNGRYDERQEKPSAGMSAALLRRHADKACEDQSRGKNHKAHARSLFEPLRFQ